MFLPPKQLDSWQSSILNLETLSAVKTENNLLCQRSSSYSHIRDGETRPRGALKSGRISKLLFCSQSCCHHWLPNHLGTPVASVLRSLQGRSVYIPLYHATLSLYR